jgi:curli biogenesis system outer membrane secretion channel CsgG
MKINKHYKLLTATLLLFPALLSAQKDTKVSFEKIQSQCTDLAYNKRVRISVSSFKVATPTATDKFGDELAQSLTNALQNVNCFNVLLSTKDMEEIEGEIQLGASGNTKAGSSPKRGQMKGAQVIVMGKVTEFAEGKNSAGALGIRIGSNKTHIGFIITLINPETREIIDSKSINVEGKGNGSSGMTFLGVNVAGSTTGNKATADAVEKGVIKAIEFIAAHKDGLAMPDAKPDAAPKNYTAANCPLLKAAYVPKVMVILPEFHITQRIPDPAAETEINRKLIEAGFQVVDAAMYAAIKKQARFIDAARDPKMAISLGKEFGADIVIYGEAFSESGISQGGKQVSCRARAEIKAVRTDNANIIAANGLEAGGIDNTEFVAAKVALRNAGGLVADYILEQFCSKNPQFSKKGAASAKTAEAKTVTEITVTNVSYNKLKALVEMLSSRGTVNDKSLTDGTATIQFEHDSKLDVADLIESRVADKFSVKSLEKGKLTIEAK